MRHFLCIFIGCFCLALPLCAQSNKMIKELESKRGTLQKQIAESETLLNTTKKDVGSQLNGLAALTGQIEERKRYILTINNDLAHIHRPHTGNSIQHGGLARTVAADYGDEIAVLQCQVQIIQGNLLVDRTGVKSLVNVFDLKHCCCRLSLPQRG